MLRSSLYSAAVVYAITAIVWAWSLWDHTFYAGDFWFYVAIFLVPGGLVILSASLLLAYPVWIRILGALLALPSLGIWILSLMLAHSEFRIH